jgi:hypothetical protein
MNFKNLLLGSITAAGVMTGAAYAADLGVLSSLDVCDQLGVSGLTISSDTNCLKISGEVSYSFSYGVWDTVEDDEDDAFAFDVPAGQMTWGYDDSSGDASILNSEVNAKLNFEATADSSFGPAKATIKLLADYVGNSDSTVVVDEAYVSIGEGTILMAGHKGSIYNNGDDAPLNWLGLFNSQAVDTGVSTGEFTGTSNAIQVSTDLGNGFSLAGGLENLDSHGAAVGVLAYKGDTVSGHVSIAADDVLEDNGNQGEWTMHAGLTATVDSLKLVAAVAADSDSHWNVLGSASATFDMFTIAGSVEADDSDYTGAGASLTAEVSEGVKLNIGGRWSDYDGDTSYEVAVGAEAALAEDLTLSGAVGYVSEEDDYDTTFTYGWAKLAWAPGGGFTSSIKGTATYVGSDDAGAADSDVAYKIEAEFKKTFE